MAEEAGRTPDRIESADRLAILQVLASHSRGLDRLDSGIIRDCYWPEAEVDYGAFKGSAHTFADLVVPALESQYELTRHALGNTLFRFAGDTALTESYVQAAHLVQGAQEEVLVYGRYLDRLQKRDDCWKLLHRQVVIEWSNRQPVADERDSPAFRDLTRGGHGSADPVFSFLDAI